MAAKFAFNCSITVQRAGPIFESSMINVIIRMLMSSILYLFIVYVVEKLEVSNDIWFFSQSRLTRLTLNQIDIELLSVEPIDLHKKNKFLGFAFLLVSQKCIYLISLSYLAVCG